MTLWKTIEDFPNYEVNEDSKVRNKITKKELTQSIKKAMPVYGFIKMVKKVTKEYILYLQKPLLKIQIIIKKLIIKMETNFSIILVT